MSKSRRTSRMSRAGSSCMATSKECRAGHISAVVISGLVLLIGLSAIHVGSAAAGTASTAGGSCLIARMSNGNPKYVVVLAEGIGSTNGGGSFPPLSVPGGYCAATAALSGNGKDTSDARFDPLYKILYNYADARNPSATTDPSLQGYFLTNVLADHGAVILPFGYSGAELTGSSSDPTFHIRAFKPSIPGKDLASHEAKTLQHELASIEKIWPESSITFIGHSEAGLIGEQWWQDYGNRKHNAVAKHVTGVMSLDSPIGGVSASAPVVDAMCASIAVPSNACEIPELWVSAPLLTEWNVLWKDKFSNGSKILKDERSGSFPEYVDVGTPSDPVYYLANLPGSYSKLFGLGEQASELLSQFQYTLQGKAKNAVPTSYDLQSLCRAKPSPVSLSSLIAAVRDNSPREIVHQVDQARSLGTWVIASHGLVMNCQNVIDAAQKVVLNPTNPAPAPVPSTTLPKPTPTTSVPASCITSPCTAGATGVEISVAGIQVVTGKTQYGGPPTVGVQLLVLSLHVDNGSGSDVTFGTFQGPTVTIVGANHTSTRWTQPSNGSSGTPQTSGGQSCFSDQGTGYTVLPGQNVTLPHDYCFQLTRTAIVFPILDVVIATQPLALKSSPTPPPTTTTTTTAPPACTGFMCGGVLHTTTTTASSG